MNIRDILLERYLVGQFTFGFEYEAFIRANVPAFRGKLTGLDDYEIFDVVWKELKLFFGRYFQGGLMATDASIVPPRPVSRYIAFEYKSPPIVATVANFEKLIKLLEDSINFGIETNKSCGFHIHVGFPSIREEDPFDTYWSVCQIAVNEDLIKMISKMGSIKFYSPEFASLKFIKNLGIDIRKRSWNMIQERLNDHKHVLIRPHPGYGTIEWRGPRDFLGTKDTPSNNRHLIETFVRLLYRYIIKLAEVQAMPTLDKTITKEEFAKQLSLSKLTRTFDKSMSGDLIRQILKKEGWWMKTVSFENALMQYGSRNNLLWLGGKWISGRWLGDDTRAPKGAHSRLRIADWYENKNYTA